MCYVRARVCECVCMCAYMRVYVSAHDNISRRLLSPLFRRCTRHRTKLVTEYRTNPKTCCPGWKGDSCNIRESIATKLLHLFHIQYNIIDLVCCVGNVFIPPTTHTHLLASVIILYPELNNCSIAILCILTH